MSELSQSIRIESVVGGYILEHDLPDTSAIDGSVQYGSYCKEVIATQSKLLKRIRELLADPKEPEQLNG